MELSFSDGYAETPVVGTQQRSRCPENSLDKPGERREPPAHTMASRRFPSTTFHIVIVEPHPKPDFHAAWVF